MFKNLFGWIKQTPDGEALARSDKRSDYGQIELLSHFVEPRPPHSAMEQQRWARVLPQPYEETLNALQSWGWLEPAADGYCVTEAGRPFVRAYSARLAAEKAAVMPQVRAALQEKDTGEALQIRRTYEARQPLGVAAWTGPEPQLSHSALTRRILFLDHEMLRSYSAETKAWLQQYAAEQHLWGAYWRLDAAEIPPAVAEELAGSELTGEQGAVEAAYWQAYQLALYVDNQETWQRCSGGDHVRRIEIAAPLDDGAVCAACGDETGKQYLVARVPELPLAACSCVRGCRLRYEPVLDMYDDLDAG